MRNRALATRYARALFETSAQDIARLDDFQTALAKLSWLAFNTYEFKKVLQSPVFEAKEKLRVIAKILKLIQTDLNLNQQAMDIIYNFCNILVDKDRINLLNDIAEAFLLMLDKAKGIKRGVLCSAIEIGEKEKESIKAKLEDISKFKLVLEFVVDKKILGGVKLQLQDSVLDASLQTQLNILRDIIKKGETCV